MKSDFSSQKTQIISPTVCKYSLCENVTGRKFMWKKGLVNYPWEFMSCSGEKFSSVDLTTQFLSVGTVSQEVEANRDSTLVCF